MYQELFLNKKAAELAGVTPRQLQSWSDKGLILPKREAKGGGSKRGYDEINLYEIRLCKILIEDMNQGIQLVKGIIGDLRKEDSLERWARDPREYFKEEWKKMGRVYQKTTFDDPKDAERWRYLTAHFHKFFIKSPIVIKRTSGVLFSFFGSKITQIMTKHWIFPELYDFVAPEAYEAMNIIFSYLSLYDAAIFVNLGQIKDYVDGELKSLS